MLHGMMPVVERSRRSFSWLSSGSEMFRPLYCRSILAWWVCQLLGVEVEGRSKLTNTLFVNAGLENLPYVSSDSKGHMFAHTS